MTTAYSRYWSAASPGCLLLLVDQSVYAYDVMSTIADYINGFLYALIRYNTIGPEVRPRIEVAVLGYHDSITAPALPGSLGNLGFATLPEIFGSPRRIEQSMRKEVDDYGMVFEMPIPSPIWLEPKGQGAAPLCHALQSARMFLHLWIHHHPHAFPPIIVVLTTGRVSDGDPVPSAKELQFLHTSDGHVLIFVLEFDGSAETIIFPSEMPRSTSFHPSSIASLIPNSLFFNRWHEHSHEEWLALATGPVLSTKYAYILNGGVEDLLEVVRTRWEH